MAKWLKRMLALVMVSVCTVGFALPASAQATLDDILKRVEALEKENASLKAEVMALQAKPAAPVQVVAAQAAAAPTGNFLKTKLDMELYGMIKADATFSDSAAASSATGNSATAAYNAPSNATKKHQKSFNMSGQSTRLGINFKPVALDDGGTVSGKFEMDFSAAQTASYNPRLRLGYVQADYEKWGVTAGQAWDFFAPVNSSTLNDANVWRAGNVGFRHPQVYLTNKWGEVLGGKLNTKIGAIDTDDAYQENSGVPVFGAYAGYDTKIAGMASSFNLGGIYGQNSTELLGVAPGSDGKNNAIYGVVASMTLKMTDWLAFKTKGFSGAKLEDFLAGNAVGVSTLTPVKGLRVMGGFAELTYNPTKKIETNVGYGIDALASAEASAPSTVWSSNKTCYTNVKYSLSKDLLVGLEYQRFDTKWISGVDSSDDRVQSSIILKF